MVEALKALTDRVQRPLTRDQILEAHARHESSQQHYTPAKRYRDLLPIVTSASPRVGVSTRRTRIASSMGGLSEIGRRSKILRERCST